MANLIIDMSKLPPPEVVRQVDYEEILAEMKADFLAAYPAASEALTYESDPLVKWLERQAYDKMLMRQQANEDALAVMLAYAKGSDLDQFGAMYQVERLVIAPADNTTIPPTPAVMESDDDFRERIQMAPSSFSVAGPADAYVFHTRSADGRVMNCTATSPQPGEVLITVLSREGDGSSSAELLAIVDKALNKEEVRPLTDLVTVQSANIIPYEIKATIYVAQGPDTGLVMDAVQKSIEAYTTKQRKIGVLVPRSGLDAALHLDGVERVEIIEPAGNVVVGQYDAAYCTSITLEKVEQSSSDGGGSGNP